MTTLGLEILEFVHQLLMSFGSQFDELLFLHGGAGLPNAGPPDSYMMGEVDLLAVLVFRTESLVTHKGQELSHFLQPLRGLRCRSCPCDSVGIFAYYRRGNVFY